MSERPLKTLQYLETSKLNTRVSISFRPRRDTHRATKRAHAGSTTVRRGRIVASKVGDAGVGMLDIGWCLGKTGSHFISLCQHTGVVLQQNPYRIGPAANPPLIKETGNSPFIGRVRVLV